MEMKRTKAAAAIILTILVRGRKRRKQKSIWAKSWLNRERDAFSNIMDELYLSDKDNYRCYVRMDTSTFEVSSF